MNFIFLLLFIFISLPCAAQISTDGALGTAIELTGPDYTINQELGKRDGANLFHSFQDFTINTGESATFMGDADIQRVISRVTGGNVSHIDGLLKSEIPNADFYFTNPAGIMFGPNASIDIDGAFHVSTADYLKFGDNETFFSEPLENDVLSAEAPIAYGFLDAKIGKITFEGSDISFKETESFTTISGDIEVEGSTITIPQGELNLISIASEGEAHIKSDDSGLTIFNLERFAELGNISMKEGSIIDVDGEGGGKINIMGYDVSINRSQISSNTLGAKDGGGVAFNVSGRLDLNNSASMTTFTIGSGDAGNIIIVSDQLSVGSGLLLSASANTGDGGDIWISTNTMTLDGESSPEFTGLLTATSSEDMGGKGGNIRIDATILDIVNGSLISSGSLGSGDGGNIAIDAETMRIDGVGHNTGISSLGGSQTERGSVGDITIETTTLKMVNGGNIQTSTQRNGVGGSIEIVAGAIDIDGSGDSSLLSGIATGPVQDIDTKGGDITIEANTLHVVNEGIIQAATNGSGDGGRIDINAEAIGIINNGLIQTSTVGSGNSGSIRVATKSIVIDGEGSRMQAITVSEFNGGKGGDINIETDSLDLLNGGLLSVQTRGSGDAGNIRIITKKALIDGRGALGVTGIDADTFLENGGGEGGDITIQAGSLKIFKAGIITANTQGSGNGGNIDIFAQDIFIDGQGSQFLTGFSAETHGENGGGKGGTITIDTQTLDIINGGEITTATEGSGDGGSIEIRAKVILLEGGENLAPSVINAQADLSNASGNAGDVMIIMDTLTIVNGGFISTSTFGSGDGGSLSITGQDVVIDNKTSTIFTGIASQSGSESEAGKSGDISINVKNLDLISGGQISARTSSRGDGGSIQVHANSVLIDAQGSSVLTGIEARTRSERNGGNGGDIEVHSTNLKILDGGIISTSGITGTAGDIKITNQKELTMLGGTITTSAIESSGGDIRVSVPLLILEKSSQINAEAGVDGGNVIMVTDAIVMNNAVISANASQGNGGNIMIQTKEIFESHDEANAITASSSRGISGNITITAPDIDLTASLFPLSEDFLEADAWSLSACSAKYRKGQIGTFTVSPYPRDSLLIDDFLPSSSFMNEKSFGKR